MKSSTIQYCDIYTEYEFPFQCRFQRLFGNNPPEVFEYILPRLSGIFKGGLFPAHPPTYSHVTKSLGVE